MARWRIRDKAPDTEGSLSSPANHGTSQSGPAKLTSEQGRMSLYRQFSFWMVQTPAGKGISHQLYSTAGPHLDRLLYRLSRGRVATTTGVVPLLLLTTVGRRSGREWVTPVVYLADGHDIILVASNVGNSGHPQWYRNLLANHSAKLSIRGRSAPYTARVADPEERARLWRRLTAAAPTYAIYQEQARRELPVVVMSPLEAIADPER